MGDLVDGAPPWFMAAGFCAAASTIPWHLRCTSPRIDFHAFKATVDMTRPIAQIKGLQTARVVTALPLVLTADE